MASRFGTLAFLTLACAGAGSFDEACAQAGRFEFDVPQSSADAALNLIARQSGTPVLFPFDRVSRIEANAVDGVLTLSEALETALRGTGLRASLKDGVITVAFVPDRQNSEGSEQMGGRRPFFASVAALVWGALGANAAAQEAAGEEEEIVVTGVTSRERPLITTSADVTFATRADIDRRAPKSTADLLELVPGIFVEGTAGELSNNYSVRGLLGGGQRFVQMEEDGLPVIYGGGGADFFFSHDITIDRLEAVRGGSSGVLTVNGAGATINFISKKPNFEETEALVRLTASDYDLRRTDFYYSAPLSEDLAFNLGGYIQSSPGVRNNPFTYDSYRLKGMVEYSFDNGGFARITAKVGDIQAPYYAPMPFAFNDGEPGAIPGLDPQRDFVGGTAFGRISVPVSTFVEADGFRDFRLTEGVRVETKQLRFDFETPITENFEVYGRARYLDFVDDFNGLFPGSGTGNAGLASAVDYLTPGPDSPINNLLTLGDAAFPDAVRFGIRNRRTSVVLGSNQTAELNALNGNGFLQQTTLNHDYQEGEDFGANVGARWEFENDAVSNSLTFGVMYYDVSRFQDQSATAAALNDVRNDSDLYDVVALDAGNNVIGALTDNGLLHYGDWGAGIREREDRSISLYANDEIAIGEKLRVDAGVRWETIDSTARDGNQAAVNQPVPPGVQGVVRDVGATWDGTFSTREGEHDAVAWTVGANYLFTPNFAVYARYADGFQTNNVDPVTEIVLYEVGARFEWGRLLSATATIFRTDFDDQFYNFIDPLDPTQQTTFLADLRTEGVELDAVLRPTDWLSIAVAGVFQDPTLTNLRLNGVPQPEFDGNRPERTPRELYTIEPVFELPNGLGDIYVRYKYIGEIFADSGNGIALPGYGVTSIGANINLTERAQFSLNAENIFDEIGLTEGNPRQGQTQNADSGFFYARGIVGPTITGALTVRF